MISDKFLARLDEPGTDRAVVVEDDGRVAYAYLLVGERIVGDVWLYNVGESPDAVDWRDRSAMPFPNPRSLCSDQAISRITDGATVSCAWSAAGATLSVDAETWAVLEVGAKPGWSRHAAKRGPLAKPLSERLKP